MNLSSFDMYVLSAMTLTPETSVEGVSKCLGTPLFDTAQSIGRLIDRGCVHEPRLWRYEITDAGREVLDALKGDGEIDPLELLYQGVARGH